MRGLCLESFESTPTGSKSAQRGSPIKAPPSLCVILPCFNESENIARTYTLLQSKLGAMIEARLIAPHSTLLFVDDGSSDETWARLCELHAQEAMKKVSAGSLDVAPFGDSALSQNSTSFVDSVSSDDFIRGFVEDSPPPYL